MKYAVFAIAMMGVPPLAVIISMNKAWMKYAIWAMLAALVVYQGTAINFFSNEDYRGTSRGMEVSVVYLFAAAMLIASAIKHRAPKLVPSWGAAVFVLYFALCLPSWTTAENTLFSWMETWKMIMLYMTYLSVRAYLNVTDDVVLRSGYRVSVAALSLLGGNYLLLEEGTGAPQPLTSTTFRGEPPVDWMRDLGAIARNLSDLTSDGSVRSIVTNFEAVAVNLNTVVARVQRGEGTIGKLLSTNETVYADLKDTLSSAKKAAANIDTIAARVERGEGTIGKLLSSNDVVHADIRAALASVKSAASNIDVIADRLAKGEGTIGKLLATNDTVYADLKDSIANIRKVTADLKDGKGLAGRLIYDKKLGEDASELLDNLKGVSARLEKGQGTLGKLVADQELYNELNGLIKDVRQIVDNYRDTTPVSTFGSLIMGGL